MIRAVVAAVFLAVLGVVYFQYRRDKNLKEALFSIVLISICMGFSLFSVYIYVYKPLFVFHVVFTIFSWMEIFKYIFSKKIRFWIFLSPLITISLFFIAGYFFAKIEP